jgi:stage II sporulation protein R
MKFLKVFQKGLLIKSLAVGLILASVFSFAGFNAKCDGIRDSVLRLHILANSDSVADQNLKLYVRDKVLGVSESVFLDCKTEQEAIISANNNIDLLKETAQNAVYEKGFDYPVTVSVDRSWFNNRDYGDFTLPAGIYEAVKVEIGSAKGKNWWCVMFPAVCLPAASNGKSNDISSVLTEDQTEVVHEKQRYKAAFWVLEMYEKARYKLSKISNK